MSSKWNKIAQNAKEFRIENFYNNMTPDQYKKSIETAIAKTKLDMTTFYEAEFKKLYEKLDNEYQKEVLEAIDTVAVELIYELAIQMNAFEEEDEYVKNSIIQRVKEIYENVMNAIKSYANIEDKLAEKQYEEKKHKIEKFFDIKFGVNL